MRTICRLCRERQIVRRIIHAEERQAPFPLTPDAFRSKAPALRMGLFILGGASRLKILRNAGRLDFRVGKRKKPPA